MKHDKTCPKCKSRNVGFARVPGSGTQALLFNRTWVASERWLCTDCGYVETYVADVTQTEWPRALDGYFGGPKTR